MQEFKDQKSRDLATKPTRQLLLQFAVPCILAMSASSIYNFCDGLFIGRGVGALALAGLAISLPLMNISSAFASLASVGGAALTSIQMGKQNREVALRSLGNVLFLDVLFALIISAISLTFLDPLLHIFGATDSILPYAHDYMQVILSGLIITFTMQGMAGQLRAIGCPTQSMHVQLIAVVSNLLLDALFIFGFGWGMSGAAYATIGGQFIAWAYAVYLLHSHHNFVFLHLPSIRPHLSVIRSIVGVGVSPFSIQLCGSVILIAINHSLLRAGGDDADLLLGVNGINSRITQLVILAVAGFGQGLSPIVGFNLGAKLYSRVLSVLREALFITASILTLGYVIIAIFPAQLTSLFTNDPDIIALSIPALRISLCTFPIAGLQMMAVNFFHATQSPKRAMLLSLSRQLLFLLPLLWFLPQWLGVNGVWWSMAVADLFSAILSSSLLWHAASDLKRRANAQANEAQDIATN